MIHIPEIQPFDKDVLDGLELDRKTNCAHKLKEAAEKLCRLDDHKDDETEMQQLGVVFQALANYISEKGIGKYTIRDIVANQTVSEIANGNITSHGVKTNPSKADKPNF